MTAVARAADGLGATPRLVLLAALLLALGLLGSLGLAIALPTAALLPVVAVVLLRPRGRAWAWLAAGSAAWTLEEAWWAAVRGLGAPPLPLLTDLLYLAGCVAWLVALLLLPNRRRPRWTLVGAPPLVALAVLLARDPAQTLTLSFPLTDLALLLAALPALEGALRGPASEGRMLWTLGLFVRALAAANYAWMGGAVETEAPFLILWLVAHLLVGLGVWLELRDEVGGLWPAASLLVGLETTFFVTTALLFVRDDAPGPQLLTIGALTYLQLLGGVVLVIAEAHRRRRAEGDLRAWREFVRGFAITHGEPRVEHALRTTWAEARRLLPDLQGLSIHGPGSLRLGVGGGYDYPIVLDGAEIARLHLAARPEGTGLLDTLAPLLGGRILQLQEQARWRDDAVTDPLTRLRNRRGLELALGGLLEAGRVEGRLAVAVLDLDHFKRVNDLHGHPFGDRVLALLADLLRQHTRDRDLAVRWGGEEFLLVLPGSGETEARAILERLRRALRERTPAPLTRPLTLSAGLAAGPVPADENAFHELVAAADEALLEAKRGGRDEVRTAAAGGA